MTTRYYAVRECEHGKQGHCDHLPTDTRGCLRLDCDEIHALPGCPGGQRRELIIDYEAAARAYADWAFVDNETGPIVRAIVDAALSGGDQKDE